VSGRGQAAEAGQDPRAALTVGRLVRAAADRYAGADAVVLGEDRLSYTELDRRSRNLARGLLARDVTKGTRIGFIYGNSPDWVVTFAAIARIGAIAVPLSTFYRGRELARVLRYGDIAGLILARSHLGRDCLAEVARALPGLAEADSPELALAEAPFLRWVVSSGEPPAMPPWRAWPARPAWAHGTDWLTVAEGSPFDEAFLAEAEAEVSPDDLALTIWTSGSSALPKGVPHTHRAVMTKATFMAERTPVAPGAEHPVLMPMFWVGGLVVSLLPTLVCGGWAACEERTPAIFALGTVPNERERQALNAETEARGIPYWALGMTETLGPYAWGDSGRTERYPLCPPLDHLQPGFDLRLVDEHGHEVPDGVRGEIVVRGPTLTPGLHKVPREQVFDADGFYHTRDLGIRDGGRLYFVGRDSEMIKTANANVAPAEVEMEMQALPGVASAYVIDVPDATRGSIVAAAVVPADGMTPDPDALIATLKGRLSSFKVPRRIVLLRREEVPMIKMSSKVHRHALRDLVAARTSRGACSAAEG
jgi:acyl-CoA synthetase (AMP-forming)/AMP-acid ligase II